MPADRKFCNNCGAPLDPNLRFCTSCGAHLTGGPPPAAGMTVAGRAGLPDQVAPRPSTPPGTLLDLISTILHGITKNIPGMVRGILAGIIIAFLLVFMLTLLLPGIYPSSQSTGLVPSPDALLFWFLTSAILAFLASQMVSRGPGAMLKKIASTPRWIGSSLSAAGADACPLLMTGMLISLLIRAYLLTPLISVQFFILALGILYSQQESIAVTALRLGYSDLHRFFAHGQPHIPASGMPVMGITGLAAGFLLGFVLTDFFVVLILVLLLLIAGTGYCLLQRRKSPPQAATGPGGAG